MPTGVIICENIINKETLNKILPEEIGSIIQSFNCCDSCNRLINLEDGYDFYPDETYKLNNLSKATFYVERNR